MDRFTSGLITLSVCVSGYFAEGARAGNESVPSVTRKAARGLGVTGSCPQHETSQDWMRGHGADIT